MKEKRKKDQEAWAKKQDEFEKDDFFNWINPKDREEKEWWDKKKKAEDWRKWQEELDMDSFEKWRTLEGWKSKNEQEW